MQHAKRDAHAETSAIAGQNAPARTALDLKTKRSSVRSVLMETAPVEMAAHAGRDVLAQYAQALKPSMHILGSIRATTTLLVLKDNVRMSVEEPTKHETDFSTD